MKFSSRKSIFNQNSPFPVNKNGFDLSYKNITCLDLGKLIPMPAKEVYPNDTMRSQIQWKMLLETLKKPIYSDLSIKFKEYGVAYRNLWKHWRNFYTGGRKGDFAADLPVVNINCKSNVKGSLFDYLGFPIAYDYFFKDNKLYMKKTKQSSTWGNTPIYVSAFPFIAYDFIYFWNFINSELQENIIYNIQDNLSNFTYNSVNYQVDENNTFRYFINDFYSDIVYKSTIVDKNIYTRCLDTSKLNKPSGVAFDYSYNLNIDYGFNDRFTFSGHTLNVDTGKVISPHGVIYAISDSNDSVDGYYKQNFYCSDNLPDFISSSSLNIVNIGFLYNVNWERDYFTSAHLKKQLGDPIGFPVNSTADFNIISGSVLGEVDMSTVYSTEDTNHTLNSGLNILTSSFFINDLRLISALSMLQEGALMSPKTFEYGSYLQFFFGKSPNTRDLQQPYFIGGFNSSFYTQEVTQQSGATDSSNALGDYAGKGSSIDTGYIDNYTHDEIGLSMLVCYIVPTETYQSSQGINRMWLRKDRFDFYNPVFAHLGFQEIQKQELYCGSPSSNQEPFGYTMSFNELRYMSDVITSYMRDDLDVWHLGRRYSSQPVLNSSYLICRPSKRIFDIIDPDQPVITGKINISTVAYRDMPELGIPELLDHRY